jgi:hypothetical protein
MTIESGKPQRSEAMFICTRRAVTGIFNERQLNEDIKAYCEQDVRKFASEFMKEKVRGING